MESQENRRKMVLIKISFLQRFRIEKIHLTFSTSISIIALIDFPSISQSPYPSLNSSKYSECLWKCFYIENVFILHHIIEHVPVSGFYGLEKRKVFQ